MNQHTSGFVEQRLITIKKKKLFNILHLTLSQQTHNKIQPTALLFRKLTVVSSTNYNKVMDNKNKHFTTNKTIQQLVIINLLWLWTCFVCVQPRH